MLSRAECPLKDAPRQRPHAFGGGFVPPERRTSAALRTATRSTALRRTSRICPFRGPNRGATGEGNNGPIYRDEHNAA
jgi:hypothetical protein